MTAVFARDVATGDFVVDGNGRFVLETDFVKASATRLTNALNLCQGEWDYDTSKGFPYYPSLLGVKNPSLSLVRSLLTDYLESFEEVRRADLSVTVDKSTRRARFTGSVLLATGDSLAVQDNTVFSEGSPL